MTRLGIRITKEATEVAEHVEGWIDEYIENLKNNDYNKKKRLINLLKAYNIKKSESKLIASWFHDMKGELHEVLESSDEDLKEAWDFLSEAKVRKLYEFVSEICSDLESYGKITKKKRKRKPEQIVKSLKYAEKEVIGKLQLTSFDPKDILTAKSFVAVNVKTGDLYYYETNSAFDIKGTTLQNFDENKSYAQRIGRYLDTFCELSSTAGVAYVNKELNKFNTKKKSATGRFNEHTVLLRVLG
jgi:hypothetical protein